MKTVLLRSPQRLCLSRGFRAQYISKFCAAGFRVSKVSPFVDVAPVSKKVP